MKEEEFPHCRKPLHWQRQGVGGGGRFRTTEKSTKKGVQDHVKFKLIYILSERLIMEE